MNTDDFLSQWADVSGECLLWTSRMNKMGNRYYRPTLSKKTIGKYGFPEGAEQFRTIARWVFFQNNPGLSPYVSVVCACRNYNCVRASHQLYGVYNGPMGKFC